MSAPVLTAGVKDTVAEVGARMEDASVGSVIVVDGDRPVGILTERDMIRFAASGASSSDATVADWMTPDPDTVVPTAGVAEAYDLLSDKGYRHFPVVEDGALVGVVSLLSLIHI